MEEDDDLLTPEEPFQRRFLLPAGCKDLIDVLQPAVVESRESEGDYRDELPLVVRLEVVGSVELPELTTVKMLALLLKVPAWEIIGWLAKLGIFATLDTELTTAISKRVCEDWAAEIRAANPDMPPAL